MNLPNKITLARILLIPLVVFFYMADFIPYGKLVAFLIFVIACSTDFIDGHIARSRGLVTDLGKFLDPIADKVLIMSALFLVVAWPLKGIGGTYLPAVWPNYIGIIGAIIMLSRELIISAFRQIAATKGIVMMAEKSGKIKAFIQDVAIAGYMLYAWLVVDIGIAGSWNTAISIILLVLFSLATILTITSGVGYIVKNKKVLAEEKAKPVEEPVEIEDEELLGDDLSDEEVVAQDEEDT